MSEIQSPEIPENPLAAKLKEVGLAEFERMVARGEIRSLTNEFQANYRFKWIQDKLNAIAPEELIEIAVPKLDEKKQPIMSNGYVQSEKVMVFKRAHVLKGLLREQKLTEKAYNAWEEKQSEAKAKH